MAKSRAFLGIHKASVETRYFNVLCMFIDLTYKQTKYSGKINITTINRLGLNFLFQLMFNKCRP